MAPQHVVDPFDVYFQEAVEVFGGGRFGCADVGDPGVVDHDVDAPGGPHDALDSFAHLPGAGHVTGFKKAGSAGFLDAANGLASAFFIYIEDVHTGALPREKL